jgi:hypothetical protein
MANNPLSKGVLTENFTGIGSVTREMVYKRARDLALLAGYAPTQVRQSDYEQAKRELTGGADIDRQDTALESLPETERWDPLPGSNGHQAQESASEDEDDEGRSETEQLVDQGAEEAERDRMFQAAHAAEKTEPRGT